jgi:hypothetical protein
VDDRAIGALEAKKARMTLSGIHPQSSKYSAGLPDLLAAWHRSLPFDYESVSLETYFTNGLNSKLRSHHLFTFIPVDASHLDHRSAHSSRSPVADAAPAHRWLWPVQAEATIYLEQEQDSK